MSGRPPRPPSAARTAAPALAAAVPLFGVVAAVLAALAAACGGDPPIAAGAARSLVLVTIDTLRADRVGFAGRAAASTPNLDRLAREGVAFIDAWSPAPVTLPAHASLLTGLHPRSHGVHDNRPEPLREGIPTLAESLRERGFRTGAFVSAEPLRLGCGLERGFDEYDGTFPPQDDALSLAERSSVETVEAALRWVRANDPRRERLFLWVHLFDPHAPYAPSPSFRGLPGHDAYDGEVAQADHALGVLLAGLGRSGALEGAAIVVASDHGEGLGQNGEETHGYYLHETTLRVPLVIAGAGLSDTEERGSRSGPASLVDVAATGIALLEPSASAAFGQGTPLVGGRLDATRSLLAETRLPFRHFRWAPIRALRRGSWKLVVTGARTRASFLGREGEESAPPGVVPTEDLVSMLDALEKSLPLPTSPAPTPSLPALPGYLHGGEGFSGAELGADAADPHERTDALRDLFRAEASCERGEPAAALAVLERLRSEDPRNPAIAYWRGRALRARANAEGGEAVLLEDALGAFREAASLSGGFLDAENLAVGCLLGLSRLREAHDALRALLESGRADARTYELWGFLRTGRPEEFGGSENPWFDREDGIRALEESLRRDPSSDRVRRRLAAIEAGSA